MRVIQNENTVPLKVWTDFVDDGAMVQIIDVLSLPFVKKQVCLMPDVHQGYGVPIGSVIGTQMEIMPNAVGVDIGCGMRAVKTTMTGNPGREVLEKLVSKIKAKIPMGPNHYKDPIVDSVGDFPDLPIFNNNRNNMMASIGTLGGGNHFIEFQLADSDNALWWMIHSGSRNIGLKVCNEYTNRARLLNAKWHSKVPNQDLVFLPYDSPEGQEYWNAMTYCLWYANFNRTMISVQILRAFNEVTHHVSKYEYDVHHNFVTLEHHGNANYFVHRKGATRAMENDMVIVPGSMGTYSIIGQGKGNPDSWQSCSHGAGRIHGRKHAKETLDLVEQQQLMEGIVHGLDHSDRLDEAPGAYKSIENVLSFEEDLLRVDEILRPIASIKA